MESRVKFENWALMIQGKEVRWQFGELNEEIRTRTINFLLGLHNIGKELVHKGIATIRLASSTANMLRGDELLIINLEGSFFLIIFDPLTTIKMMAQKVGEVPEDLDLEIRSVLIGQASITYANLWSVATEDSGMHIDMLFKQALDEILSMELQKELNIFVERGSCSFAGLNTIQCLIFHFILRRFFELEYLNLISEPWAIAQRASSLPVFLEYKAPKHPHLLAGYLTVINQYVQDIFNTRLQSMVFGGGDLVSIDLIHGREHFMSVCNPERLFRSKEFQKKFNSLDSKVKSDLRSGLSEYLAKSIATVTYQINRRKTADELMRELQL